MKFRNEKYQELIDRDGVIKLPFLNPQQIEEYKNFITTKTPIIEMSEDYGLVAGVCFNDKVLKYELHKKIEKTLLPILDSYLKDYKPLVFTSLVKGTGTHSKLDIHQDWSVVNEEKDYSWSLWIPLIDCTIENGTLFVIKGSHKKLNNIRGGTIPSVFDQDKEELIKLMKPIEVKAGEALIFYQNLCHFSPPNLTDTPRVTLISSLVPKNAEVFQYFMANEGVVEEYKVDDAFFLQFDDFIAEKDKTPKGTKTRELENAHKIDNVLELMQSCSIPNQSIFRKLFNKYISPA